MTTTPDTLNEVSQVAYGKLHRLRLMLVILDVFDGCASQKQVTAESGVSPASVKQVFDDLVSLGMLEPHSGPDPRCKYFRVVDGVGWSWARELSSGLWPTNQTRPLW